MDYNIEYEVLADNTYLFFDIPDNGEKITVHMRQLSRRDRAFIPPPDDVEHVEKLLAMICLKWGDREGITALELLQDSREDAVIILAEAFQRYLQKRVSFTKRA